MAGAVEEGRGIGGRGRLCNSVGPTWDVFSRRRGDGP